MYSMIDSNSDNIPTSFSSAAGSLLLSGAPSGGKLSMINTTAQIIAFTVTSHPTTVPASSTSDNTSQYLIPAAPTGGSASITLDGFKITQNDKIYIRSTGTSISSGRVMCVIW